MAGQRVRAAAGFSTIMADMDFETKSSAGYDFDEDLNKWVPLNGSPPYGLPAVGAAKYAEHHDTEVLCLWYDLKEGKGPRYWAPGLPLPVDLFEHMQKGLPIEAHNTLFEFWIWLKVCVVKYGWPVPDLSAFRCSMAKCMAFSVPAKLGNAGKILRLDIQKDKIGENLIRRYSMPKKPTKNDPARWHLLQDNPADAGAMSLYCLGDIRSEAALSQRLPDLQPRELELFKLDLAINVRGVYVDKKTLDSMGEILRQAIDLYEPLIAEYSGVPTMRLNTLKEMAAWLLTQGVPADAARTDTGQLKLGADEVETLLEATTLTPAARKVLELRRDLGGNAVKKIKAIELRLTADNRLHDLFAFCGADRSGRFSGRGPQPQNLPAKGPKVKQCDPVNGCGRHYGRHRHTCPWCGTPEQWASVVDWGPEAVNDAAQCIQTNKLAVVEQAFGDPLEILKGSLRGLFSAAPGHRLLCSDYSAIEAVVLAMLAREQWRIDVFRTHGKIYEKAVADITGIPFADVMAVPGYDITQPEWWKQKATGPDHPDRKKVGKVSELASGYQGSVGAWKAFGADEFMDDDQILAAVRKWRAASPSIVAFWYDLERAAMEAIRNPGTFHRVNDVGYGVFEDVLYCRLPSGRFLHYHQPRVEMREKFGKMRPALTYWGNNSDYKKGPKGWLKLDTYGGKLCENITQAVARDILANAMLNLEAAGYPIVLHVHDEIVSEVPEGWGCIEEFERIMNRMPSWAADYPIKCAGGWVGARYRKD